MRKLKFISLLIVAVLAIAVPFQTSVLGCSKDARKSIKFVPLGDSIAYGVGASSTDKNYVGLFSNYLSKKYKSCRTENMTVPGITSSQLLAQLTTPELLIPSIPEDFPLKDYAIQVCKSTKNAVKTADIITISIGGNNMLEGFDVVNGKIDFDIVNKGISDFAADWPKIIQAIRKLNPDVRILAMTVYNPFRKDDQIYSIADGLISKINAVITTGISGSKKYYKVVDVYGNFYKYKDVSKLTHFYESYDIHPTDMGYELIYKLHKKAFDSKL